MKLRVWILLVFLVATSQYYSVHSTDLSPLLTTWHEDDHTNHTLLFTRPREKEIDANKWKFFIKKITHADEDETLQQFIDAFELHSDVICDIEWRQEMATNTFCKEHCFLWIRTSELSTIATTLKDFCNIALVLKNTATHFVK